LNVDSPRGTITPEDKIAGGETVNASTRKNATAVAHPGEYCLLCGRKGLEHAMGGFAEQGEYKRYAYEFEGDTDGRFCPACQRSFQMFIGAISESKPEGTPGADAPFCPACGTKAMVDVGSAFVKMGPYNGKIYDKEGDATHYGCVTCGEGALTFSGCPVCPACGSRHAILNEMENGYECTACGQEYETQNE